MAKKVVATLKTGTGKQFTKCIKMVKSDKTGAYIFKEGIIANDQVKDFSPRRNKCNALGETNVFGSQGRKESSAGPDSENNLKIRFRLIQRASVEDAIVFSPPRNPAEQHRSSRNHSYLRSSCGSSTRQNGNKFASHHPIYPYL